MTVLMCVVMCVASTRSSSRASSSSCASSIAEEDSEFSETSDGVAEAGDVFVPPRPVSGHRTSRRQRGVETPPQRKPLLKPSTAERRTQHLAKSPKTVSREPPSSSASGWRARPKSDARPVTAVASETGLLSADSTGSQVQRSLPTTPVNTGVFKVPKTPPVSTLRPRDAGSRIPRTVPVGEERRAGNGAAVGQPATVIGTGAESKTTRAATPPPRRLHSSNSDIALSAAGSASSTRTQSGIPTPTRARHRDAGTGSRGSSPSSVK